MEDLVLGTIEKCKSLNIRSRSVLDSDILCSLPKGSEIMIDLSFYDDDFYKVYTEVGLEGFGMKKYIACMEE